MRKKNDKYTHVILFPNINQWENDLIYSLSEGNFVKCGCDVKSTYKLTFSVTQKMLFTIGCDATSKNITSLTDSSGYEVWTETFQIDLSATL